MKKIFYLFLTLYFIVLYSPAKILSPNTKVYLVTVGPGDELYSGFGHSALWFQDTTLQMDRVYNYGTFHFDSKFYIKFTRGILDYMLSVHEFKYLLEDAQEEQRYLTLQELNLSDAQKENLFFILEQNYQPENKYYRYDFFYDNCSSRIREIMKKACGDSLKYDFSEQLNLSFRQLIDLYLHDKRVQDLGMDIGLGTPADKKATPAQYMFLPEFLKKGFDKAQIYSPNGWIPLVKKEIKLFTPSLVRDPEPTNYANWLCWGIALAVMLYTFFNMTPPNAGYIFDGIWFSITGLLGNLILFLWFFTDHNTTQNNCDILWAVPFNILLVYPLFKKKNSRLIIGYLLFLLICNLTLLFGWSKMPEEMNPAVFPLVLINLWRLMKLLYDRMSIFPKN